MLLVLQDLIQFPDRENWYKAKFVADDAPDWNAGRFARSREAAPNLREITLEAEISREKVPLRNGYRHVGQRARVRVNGGTEIDCAGQLTTLWNWPSLDLASAVDGTQVGSAGQHQSDGEIGCKSCGYTSGLAAGKVYINQRLRHQGFCLVLHRECRLLCALPCSGR